MSYPLQPITHQQALANRQSAAGKGKWLFMLTFVGGITAVIAFSYVVADVTATPAWICLVLGTALAAVGYAGARSVMRQVRYRITVFLSALRLLLMLGCVALVVWGVGAAHVLPGRAVRGLIIAAVVAAVLYHLSSSTLFNGDCFGLRFRKAVVRWDYVSQVVFAAAGTPNTVEIGVRLLPGAPLNPMPVKPGECITDLPYRVMVRANKFDVARMQWVVNQSGRQNIPLLERTPTGERAVDFANRAV